MLTTSCPPLVPVFRLRSSSNNESSVVFIARSVAWLPMTSVRRKQPNCLSISMEVFSDSLDGKCPFNQRAGSQCIEFGIFVDTKTRVEFHSPVFFLVEIPL
jgi:hypothetical protein